MQRINRLAGVALLSAAVVLLPLVQAQEAAGVNAPLVSIKELMEKTITPATNTLWNAFDPPTDDATWLALEEAAITLLVAARATAEGGTGPMDNEWAANPAWQAMNQAMAIAGQKALQAVRSRDHDALLAAGDELYPPCEACHQSFNPGVVGQ